MLNRADAAQKQPEAIFSLSFLAGPRWRGEPDTPRTRRAEDLSSQGDDGSSRPPGLSEPRPGVHIPREGGAG